MFRHALTISAILCFTAPLAPGDTPPAPAANPPLVSWRDAGKCVGREVIVQGRIVQARNIGAICFLNFDSERSFTAIVRKGSYKNFPKPPDQLYGGKTVQIRGKIGVFRDKPELEIKSPDAVRIVEREEPVSAVTTTQAAEVAPPAPNAHPSRAFDGTVTVATYNLLNLFDGHDDPYRDDEGTPEKPEDQLRALAASIRAVDADVLCVQEVENRDVLESFVRGMLFDMGYREIVSFESNDMRGIECGVLSRFPVGPVTSHRFRDFDDGAGGKARFRRDLLQVRIEPPGHAPFDVFVVHLKSKRGDAASTLKDRMGEAHAIRAVLGDALKHDSAARFLICGDFNDTWDSEPLKTLVGNGPARLVDFVAELPKGGKTYNRGRHAEMIDFILCSPALAKTYAPKSYRIFDGSIATTGSDHNAVCVKFDFRSASPVSATGQPVDSPAAATRPAGADAKD